MPLTPGTRLGPYEVVAPLGAGGMGEVYRARDARLGREVAIKVLPEHLSASAEVRSRFEREARTVSSLNHPNICVLHDVGREGDVDFLVMELVEGETLTQRLARGPLPIDEVLRIGARIADALDRAHRAGVVHRDLKPGNVMLAKSGVKLMDFGLARSTGLAAAGSGVSAAALTQSPTVAQPLTAEGSIVGTFHYMAPEQLEGREADARSDLWALGCVLYEMATGRRAFDGTTQASLISAIMRDVPRPIPELVPMSPPGLDRLVRQCLAKDPDERWQSAGDVRRELEWVAGGSSAAAMPAVATRRRRSREPLAWAIAGVLLVAVAVMAFATLRTPRGATAVTRLTMLPPENANIDDDETSVQISPDGRSVVFIATDSLGASQLWVRDLADADARPLPGTQQALLPFWSPDSRSIAFFADGRLKRIGADGRNVQTLCEAPDGRGGAWSPNGTIVFAPVSTSFLMRVSESGGAATALTALDSTIGEQAQRFPSFLPDGRRFLYASLCADSLYTRMASLDDPRPRHVRTGDQVARFAAPGHIMFVRAGNLFVQPFDPASGRLRGEPRVLGPAPGLSRYAGAATFSVSATGAVAQRHRVSGVRGLEWVDREGRHVGNVPVAAAAYSDLALAPDDHRVAVVRTTAEGSSDVWTIDAASGIATRLTFGLPFCEKPTWSSDGRWIAFSAIVGSGRNLYRKLATGAGDSEKLLDGPTFFTDPAVWTPDDRTLVFRDLDPRTGEDIWRLPLDGDRKPVPLLHGLYHEEDANLSPDGRWLSYRSDESGRAELYVQSFPVPEQKHRVSTEGGGTQSRSSFGRAFWRRDGRELVYVGGDGVTVRSVPIDLSGGFHAGRPRPLFRLPAGCAEMVATSDLQRFLILEERSTKESGSIQLTANWPAALTDR